MSISKAEIKELIEQFKNEKYSYLSYKQDFYEFRLVQKYLHLAQYDKFDEDVFDKIISAYNAQKTHTVRTATSISLQQYSTAAPIAYLMAMWCGANDPSKSILEPTAGNGLLSFVPLSVGASVTANEISSVRWQNLRKILPPQKLHAFDAKKPFPAEWSKKFDIILANPPFGEVEKKYHTFYGSNLIDKLDPLVSLHALDCMKDDGKAAILIGGELVFKSQTKDLNTALRDELYSPFGNRYIYKSGVGGNGGKLSFFKYLYAHYNVVDVIDILGSKLYQKQGTTYNLRLILIDGRKKEPEIISNPPTYDPEKNRFIQSFYELKDRMSLSSDRLGGVYVPLSKGQPIGTETPDSMDIESKIAKLRLQQDVGDIDLFVQKKLGYSSKSELYKALKAEQVEGVALTINNIDKGQGTIIGDQTGIGKGRQIASIIRMAIENGYKPIFFTIQPNLFTDIIRDLFGIGSKNYKPLVINYDAKVYRPDSSYYEAEEEETNSQILFEGSKPEFLNLYNKGRYSAKECKVDNTEYDFVLCTYSQINGAFYNDEDNTAANKYIYDERTGRETYSGIHEKGTLLAKMSKGNVLILDESHVAAGTESQTGAFMQSLVMLSKSVVYSSATYAKQPKNIGIYIEKTSLKKLNIDPLLLELVFSKGKEPLQEVVATNLVMSGQYFRRQRTYQGVDVRYISFDDEGSRLFGVPDLSEAHIKFADNLANMLQLIARFEVDVLKPIFEKVKDYEYDKMGITRSDAKKIGADINRSPIFSYLFNVVQQFLLSLKAEAVALQAIKHIEEKRKPVIALANTMEAFLEENPLIVEFEGEEYFDLDYGRVLHKIFNNTFQYRVKVGEDHENKVLNFDELLKNTYFAEYFDQIRQAKIEKAQIFDEINRMKIDLCASPIDLIKFIIESHGYSIGEITGRSAQYTDLFRHPITGIWLGKKKSANFKKGKNETISNFNNNQIDAIVFNRSGSTGLSLHAIPTELVPESSVLQRVLLVLQFELDINEEIQKRGRVFRTGQILNPIFEYYTTVLPIEKRLLMMLVAKLRSLDANTAGSQKNSKDVFDYPNFINKYGDRLIVDYLNSNPRFASRLGQLLNSSKDVEIDVNLVLKRLPLVTCEEQLEFYKNFSKKYNTFMNDLTAKGLNDLEIVFQDYRAKSVNRAVIMPGKRTTNVFEQPVFLETADCTMQSTTFFTQKDVVQMAQNISTSKYEQNNQSFNFGGIDSFMEKFIEILREINPYTINGKEVAYLSKLKILESYDIIANENAENNHYEDVFSSPRKCIFLGISLFGYDAQKGFTYFSYYKKAIKNYKLLFISVQGEQIEIDLTEQLNIRSEYDFEPLLIIEKAKEDYLQNIEKYRQEGFVLQKQFVTGNILSFLAEMNKLEQKEGIPYQITRFTRDDGRVETALFFDRSPAGLIAPKIDLTIRQFDEYFNQDDDNIDRMYANYEKVKIYNEGRFFTIKTLVKNKYIFLDTQLNKFIKRDWESSTEKLREGKRKLMTTMVEPKNIKKFVERLYEIGVPASLFTSHYENFFGEMESFEPFSNYKILASLLTVEINKLQKQWN